MALGPAVLVMWDFKGLPLALIRLKQYQETIRSCPIPTQLAKGEANAWE